MVNEIDRGQREESSESRNRSFASFFSDLGFQGKMVMGEDINMRYEQWKRTSLINLEYIMCNPLGSLYQGKDGAWLILKCLRENTKRANKKTFSGNEVKNLSITIKNGTEFTFTKAKFDKNNNKFIIATTVKPKKGATFNGEYTVSDLREMLVEKFQPQQGLGHRIIAGIFRK